MLDNEQLNIIVQQIDDKRKEKCEWDAKSKACERVIEELEEYLKEYLKEADTDSIVCGNCVFGYKDTKHKALDQKLLKEKYPQQFEDCYVEKTGKSFYFKGVY